jgi:hypothetical protein
MQKIVSDAHAALKAMTPDQINALEGKDVTFQLGELQDAVRRRGLPAVVLAAESLFPRNHRYDILRSKGVPLGKRDFMGSMRMKR